MSNVNDFVIIDGVLKRYTGTDAEVVIPDGVTQIDDAFNRCIWLKSVNIPDSVTKIGRWAFSHCTSLTSINIPDSVTVIGPYAFSDCTSLTSITISNAVMKIDGSVFGGCTSLIGIDVKEENRHYVSIDGNLYRKKGKTLIQYANGKKATSFEIPDYVTEIGPSAFYGCTSLTSITIPNSVTKIGSSAFSGCTSLTSITIPQGVTRLEWGAFRQCENLESAVIPASVTKIEQEAFNLCWKLSRLEIYGSPKIANYSFEGIQLSFFKAPELVATNGFAWWRERFGEVNTYIAAFDNFDVGSKIAKYAKRCYEDAFRALVVRDRIDLIPNFLSMWKKFDMDVFERLVSIANCEQKIEFSAFLLNWKNDFISKN